MGDELEINNRTYDESSVATEVQALSKLNEINLRSLAIETKATAAMRLCSAKTKKLIDRAANGAKMDKVHI